ncbi:mitochondrial substrate carrier family protein [Dictyostelium discoideum AX4]|uniref:Mitochondrial substrate carrier family protein H n=1 Tax=Dictyostelium discoideum TaxID=44689 RepID=S2540_DICDI|nr:mitochondrial substrate carrier family protein [Dictyostelium discoideum AX4]Q552L9.1 RecName: Full=Mitochondrial substrate carrier family protein H; AltName: Full=Solute carrier family 25 member 40 homolog [Dictyostelium discoideum]EAL69449.1 mitochondrial substrate carrier family protein [Dictyostelium discoideum AX4]|eukprot:XP_643363.1 mitochondrial substrate carrier family protein [Dictyostelium discoideum AX4]
MLSNSVNNNNNNNNINNSNSNNNDSNIHKNVKKLMVASIFGGIMSSLIVTPLDVVKTRLQTQNTGSHINQKHVFKGTLDAFKKIYKNEGPLTFWRGVTPSLLMTIPSATIYFTSYEYLKEYLYQFNDTEAYNIYTVPLVAGTLARIFSASVTSPFELLRTNSQGIVLQNAYKNTVAMAASSSTATIGTIPLSSEQRFNSFKLYRDIVNNVGIKGLWRGLGPTLVRDVPFSAIYWAGYEVLKNKLMKSQIDPNFSRNSKSPFFINFIAGATSGTLAAVLTTPIDVIKTRIQMSAQQTLSPSLTPQQQLDFIKKNNSSIYHLKQILSQEGWKGLTKGLVPRVAKVSPACAIMISTFEYIKQSHIADDN